MSTTWENEWLTGSHQTTTEDDSPVDIPSIIESKTVLLRIDHGSTEAGFLAAFCPINQAPTLVIIRNGTVVDKLERDVGHEEWTQRLLKACGVGVEKEADTTANVPTQPEQSTSAGSPEATVAGGETVAEGAENTMQEDATPLHHQPEQLQAMLAERGQRLEAERLRREAREKAERIARARARREEEERAQAQADKGKQRADGSDPAKQKARNDWLQQQAKRKQEAKEEKQRIMARIEADKRERKQRDEERKQAASAMAGEPLPAEVSKVPLGSKIPPSSGTCAIQVRLFDGSSIKGKFAHDSTLSAAVREWIKEVSPAGGADIPYNFRQVLTPHPSRTIEISEEGHTLSDVGLMPTATLVLVPVAGFTEAYSSTGGGGIMGSAYNLVSGAFGLAGSALGYVTGYGGPSTDSQGGGGLYMGGTADEQEPSNVQGSRLANADSGTRQGGFRVKTMAEQRAENEKGAEFYNGNSLGTEGRKDDDTNKKQ